MPGAARGPDLESDTANNRALARKLEGSSSSSVSCLSAGTGRFRSYLDRG